MERLAAYVERAQVGDIEGLIAMLNADTDAEHTHPNQIILGAALIFRDIAEATGQSAIPLIKSAADRWDDSGRRRAPRSFLWSAGGGVIPLRGN